MHRTSTRALQTLAGEEEVQLRLRGTCMEPYLADGNLVSVRRRRMYWPGDVLVFRLPSGELAAHRLVGFRPAGLVTRGDHCVIHDAPVPRDAVIGAVVTPVTMATRLRSVAVFIRIVMRRLAA